MTLGVGHGGAPPPVASRPTTIAQALTAAAPDVDLSRLASARVFRGRSVMLRLAGGGAFAVADDKAVKLSGPGVIQQIHEGTWAGAWSGGLNFAISLALLVLTTTGFWSWARRAWRNRPANVSDAAEILVAHASQTGTAARLADATAKALASAGGAPNRRRSAVCRPQRCVASGRSSSSPRRLGRASFRRARRLRPALRAASLAGVQFALLGARRQALRATSAAAAKTLRAAFLASGARETAPMTRADGDPSAAWTGWLQMLRVAVGLRFGDGAPAAAAATLRISERARLDDPRAGETRETWRVVLESDADLNFRPAICCASRRPKAGGSGPIRSAARAASIRAASR